MPKPADPTVVLGARSFPTVPGYDIIEEIGRGGMGVVYKARQTKLHRIVALKMILAAGHASDEELVRFKAEAEAIAQLQHPSIVQVFEVGEHDGLPFFSLEFIEGGSLDRRLKRQQADPQSAARLVEVLARAVHYAHEHGVVHRDLKPANVLLTGSHDSLLGACVPRIVDFGLAKKLNDNSGLTRSGEVMGTPSYMAPEQAAGNIAAIGPLADVYALGGILYELLTGQPPFRAGTLAETLNAVLHDEPVHPGQLRPGVPRDLETICLKCLEKQPARRYASAGELADDLGRFLQGETVRARPVGTLERGWRWAKRRPSTVLAAMLVAVLLLAGGGGWWLWQRARQNANAIDEAALKVEYYSRLSHPEGEPVLDGPLDSEKARGGQRCYRVNRRNGLVKSIEVVGGPGRLIRHNPYHLLAASEPRDVPLFEAEYQYERDAGGTLQRVKALAPGDELLWTIDHDNGRARYAEKYSRSSKAQLAGTFEVLGSGDEREVWSLGDRGSRQASPSGAHGIRVVASANRTLLTFLEAQGKTFTKNKFAACEVRIEAGDAVLEAWLDANGQPAVGPEGFAVRQLRPEPGGGLRLAGFDASGKEINGRAGFHAWIVRFDGSVLETERTWVRTDGKAVLADQEPVKEGITFGERGTKLTALQAARLTRTRKDGKLVETSYWYPKADGSFVLRLRVNPSGWVTEEVELTDEGVPRLDKDGDHRVVRTYDARGNNLTDHFFGIDGKPVLSRSGYHSTATKYDEKNNPVETSYLGLDGKPIMQKNGYHRLTQQFDERGNAIERLYFGLDGKPCLTADKCQRWTSKYDSRDNVLQDDFFGLDGKPIMIKYDFARRTLKYDAAGKLLDITYWVLDHTGALVFERRRDDKYHVLEQALYTPDGKPRFDEDGVHRWISEFDDQGRVVGVSALGVDGKPALYKQGYHRWAGKLNEHGKATDSAYFGLDGKPCLHASGYHRIVTKFDANDRQSELAYFGIDGKPCLHNDGNHRWTMKYDDHGNEIERAYFGLDGKLTVLKSGYARLDQKYNSADKLVEKTYWTLDAAGTLVLHSREDDSRHVLEQALYTLERTPRYDDIGIHRWINEYDDRGRRISLTVLGTDGKPAQSSSGYHRWTCKLDDQGHATEFAYFGLNGKPCLHNDGNHRVTLKHDERGNEIERAFFGLDGKPIAIKAGYARLNQKFNRADKLIEKTFWTLDAAGALVLDKREDDFKRLLEKALYTPDGKVRYDDNGVHRWTNHYDDRGRRIGISALGVDGKPALYKQGYHRWMSKLDDRGNVIEYTYFGIDDKPCRIAEGYHCVKKQYDTRGKQTEATYFDTDGKPCLYKDGYHRLATKFDDNGKQTETAYFGLDGKPCLHTEGNHRFTMKYDERGNEIERSYLDLNGKPFVIKAGYARMTQKYNNANKVVEKSFWILDHTGALVLDRREDDAKHILEKALYTPEGKPRWNEFGNHRWINEFDERGRIVAASVLGVDGKPTVFKPGYHRWANKLDERGNVIEAAYFAIDGKPFVFAEGYHRNTRKYDARNKQIESAFFGADGKPCLHTEGHHRWTALYDEKSNLLETSSWGLDGKPALNKDGIARKTYRRDTEGRLLETAFFDVDGKPVAARAEGYARLTNTRNNKGDLLNEVPFDAAGKALQFQLTVAKTVSEKAREAGIQAGDEVVRFNGEEVRNRARYTHLRTTAASGKPVKLELLREGKPVTVELPSDLSQLPLDQKVRKE
jgi:tRNA A-37 threonylcarbamoyl transferase component Bud32